MTGMPRGFGFVTMGDQASFDAVMGAGQIELNGKCSFFFFSFLCSISRIFLFLLARSLSLSLSPLPGFDERNTTARKNT